MSDGPREASVEVERRGEAVVARLGVAQPREQDYDRLNEQIDKSAGGEPGVSVVVLDMSQVGMLTSMGLGMLVQISTKCRSRGQTLKLADYHAAIAAEVARRPDVTLEELRAWLLETYQVTASLGLIHKTLAGLGLTLKKIGPGRGAGAARCRPATAGNPRRRMGFPPPAR